MSEIDDIFAGKAKGKVLMPSPSSYNPSHPADKKKRKKKKKVASVDIPVIRDASPVASSLSKKRSAPETVVDTSYHLAGPAKRHKGEPAAEGLRPSKPCSKKATDPDVLFKDSRGISDRRKTEEGWLVYKEDELGIGDEGGDTPLCPFDCDCCF